MKQAKRTTDKKTLLSIMYTQRMIEYNVNLYLSHLHTFTLHLYASTFKHRNFTSRRLSEMILILFQLNQMVFLQKY